MKREVLLTLSRAGSRFFLQAGRPTNHAAAALSAAMNGSRAPLRPLSGQKSPQPPSSGDFSFEAFSARLSVAKNAEEATGAFAQTYVMPLLAKYPRLTLGSIGFIALGGPNIINWAYIALKEWYEKESVTNLSDFESVVSKERVERSVDRRVLDACRSEDPLKFIVISGPPGVGKTVSLNNVFADLTSRKNFSDKTKRYFSLTFYLDATDFESLWVSTCKLARKLGIDPSALPWLSKEKNFAALVGDIKAELADNPGRWVLAFDNVGSLDLLKKTGWYPRAGQGGFHDKNDGGRIIIVRHDSAKDEFNPFDLREKDLFEFVPLTSFSSDEKDALLRAVFEKLHIDAAAIPGLISGIKGLVAYGVGYPLVLSTIAHYVATQQLEHGSFDFDSYRSQLTSPNQIEQLETEYEKVRMAERYPDTLRRILKTTLKQDNDPMFKQFVSQMAFSPTNDFSEELLKAYAKTAGSDYKKLIEKTLALGWLVKQYSSHDYVSYVMHPAIKNKLSTIMTRQAWIAYELTSEDSKLFSDSNKSEKVMDTNELKRLLLETDELNEFSETFDMERRQANANVLLSLLRNGEIYCAEDLRKFHRLLAALDATLKIDLSALDVTTQARLYYLRGKLGKLFETESIAAGYFKKTTDLLAEVKDKKIVILLSDAHREYGFLSLREGGVEHVMRANQLLEGSYDKRHPKMLAAKLDTIKILGASGRYGKALESLQKLQMEYEKLNDVAGKAEVLYFQGFAQKTVGNYEAALSCYQAAQRLRRSLFAKGNIDQVALAKVSHDIGVTLRHLGRFDQAIEALKESVNFYEALYADINPNHKDLAVAYNDLGLTYQKQGSVGDAKKYLSRALESRRAYHGKHHPAVARSLESLGDLCFEHSSILGYSSGYQDDAIRYYEKCLEIRKQNYTEPHDETARAYLKLAQAYQAQTIALAELNNEEPDFTIVRELLDQTEEQYQAREAVMKKSDPENVNIQNMLKATQYQLRSIADMKEALDECESTLCHEHVMSLGMS